MGTKERRQREFEAREQLFLQTTRDQLCEKGLLGLQMAAVAKASDYATGTLYKHFASKEDLLLALCSQLADKRVDYFRRIREWDAPSRQRVLGFSIADTLFAQHNPEHFRLEQFVMTEVIWKAASEQRREQFLRSMEPLGRMVEGVVQTAIDNGEVDAHGGAPLTLTLGQWTMTKGMLTLVHAEGVLPLYGLHDPYRMLLRNVQLQLNALEWQPLMDPFDDAQLDREVMQVCEQVFPEECAEKGMWRSDG